MWSGAPQCSELPQKVRIFSPELKKIAFPTKLIRLEFNSTECLYYTELDAVELVGQKANYIGDLYHDRAEGFQMSLTTRLLKQLSLTERQTSINEEDDEEFEKWGYFAILPDEVIQQIMSYLDIISLCNVAQTCSLLLKNAYDPLQCIHLDLQSRWNTVDDVALESLIPRCSSLQQLNLSWTGGGGQITESAVCNFLERCGGELRVLRLGCCQYVEGETISTIVRVCTELEELDLQSCKQLTSEDLQHIHKLKKLKRLNLYSMRVDTDLLDTIGKCTRLEHLNLGALTWREPTDKLNKHLSQALQQLKGLRSLDLWRCKFAYEDTMVTLAENCPLLEELDIGWCGAILQQFSMFRVRTLVSKCTRLKKLFLTSARNIKDFDLRAVGECCPDMEQIDILGTNAVTEMGVTQLCKGCKKLFFFDLSFCKQLTDEVVIKLKEAFPHVMFKKSFQ